MQRVLDLVSGMVRRRPGAVLAAVGLMTVAMGVASTQVVSQVDIEEFAPTDLPAANALGRVQDDLGAGQAGITVIVDGGAGGNVLSMAGLEAAVRIEDEVRSDEGLERYLADDDPIAPAVVSYASPVIEVLEAEGAGPADLDAEEMRAGIEAAYSERAVVDQVGQLLSDELDGESGTEPSSRAGLVRVDLEHGLDEQERMDAALLVREVVEAIDPGEVEVITFSDEILREDLQQAMNEEIPVLIGLSLLVIVVVLMAALRQISDVLISLVAIAVALVWVFGAIGILGPGVLGVTGGFSQMAVAVPVILIGLGVDYAFHLTGRYREELAKGASPADAIVVHPGPSGERWCW